MRSHCTSVAVNCFAIVFIIPMLIAISDDQVLIKGFLVIFLLCELCLLALDGVLWSNRAFSPIALSLDHCRDVNS